MWSDLKTLFWLQWRMTVAMFRSRRLHVWARLGRVLLALVILVFTLPLFVAMGVGLGFLMARVSPEAAFELAIVANSAMLFFWLLLPASYNSELIERFELSRLFMHPIRFGSLVTGSTLVSLLSFVGVWTVPLLLGQVVGIAWHAPWMLPIILLGTLAAFATLTLTGRVMEDVFDLVASDRRLRGLLIFILTLPFILLFFGNLYLQFATRNPQHLEQLVAPIKQQLPTGQEVTFFEGLEIVLTNLKPSRLLLWLPPGWATAGMILTTAGQWPEGLGFLALSLAFSSGLLWVHATLTRKLMQGAAIRIGGGQVRRRRRALRLPGPPVLQALIEKDWTYLRRSPATARALLATPILIVALGVGAWQLSELINADSPLGRAIPAMASTLLVVSINMSTSNFTANYFGNVDREGFATLMLTPIDRRYVLLSANLVTLLFALAQTVVLLAIVAAITRAPMLLPWGVLLALCLHLMTAPAYNMASILTPYRAPLQVWGGNTGNLGFFLGFVAAAPPVMALFLVPHILWPAGQWLTVPLAVVLSAGVYLLALKPVAGVIDRRTHQILEAVLEEN